MQKKSIGSEFLTDIKYFCLNECGIRIRFIILDALNKPSVTNFYKKNKFHFFTSDNIRAQIRPMYFNLKELQRSITKNS